MNFKHHGSRRSPTQARLWTAFVVFMLLASVLPAFTGAASAQDDPQAQIGDQPVQNLQPVDQPTEEPTAEVLPTEEPTAPDTQQQDQLPPDQLTPTVPVDTSGSIEVRVHGCPPGQDLSAPDPTVLSGACTGAQDASFSLVGTDNPTSASSNTGDGGPGVAFFGGLPMGSFTLSLASPFTSAMAVFCEGNTPYGNTKPYAQAFLAGPGTGLDVLPEEKIVCDWYLAQPDQTQQATENSVTVYKWQCVEGTEYGQELLYYQGGLPDQQVGPCETEHLNIPITLTDGNGDHPTTTQANGTEWDNLVPTAQGQIIITETIPPGYGNPMVFCSTLDEDTQSPVMATAGSITLTPPAATPFTYQCNWYNIPDQGGTITVYKWQCEPGTEYGQTLEYYQGGLPTQQTGPCETEHLNVPITLTDRNGDRATTTQANGTEWDNVLLRQDGTFQVAEQIPAGYGDPMVFCGTLDDATQTLVPSTGGRIVITPASSPFDYQCNWYNIPAKDSTVTIRKWECPQGMTIEQTAQAHQSACTQPMDNVTFTLSDSKGPRSQATAGGQVQWTDVALGAVSIAETIPPGYLPQPYVVCGFTATYNGAIIDGFPQPVDTINGVLNITLQYPGTNYFCDWYNQYAGPGEITIYKWTCPESYDVTAWNANPKQDCTEATNGITFVLDQPQGVDLQTNTGDSINGAVYFGGLEPGDYTVNEIVPSGIASVFVLDCVGINTSSVHPVPLSFGPTLPIKVSGGDKIVCDWYNVPAWDPQYGWMTVTKYSCTTPQYTSDVDCEVFEGGKGFELRAWNGTSWASAATGTTNGAGQLTWINLTPGTYKVVEQGGTPCRIDATPKDGQGNPTVQANAGTTVKVYNCGVTPPAGGKMPTKYPNTGVDPSGASRDLPAGMLFGALGLLGTTTLTRRQFLRRAAVPAAMVAGGSVLVTSSLASQPIQPIEPIGPEGTPAGTPEGSPAPCLFPATPEATPEGVLPGTPVACARGEVPTHITIEAIGVDANIEVLEIVGGEMQAPTGATDVAWYKESARLGEPGNILMAGHLNYWGVPEGVFFKLDVLKEGDVVEVTGDDEEETFRYIVQWADQFPSDEEPPEEALGQTPEQAITLITCGGEWVADRAEYDHRTLVRAVRDTEVTPAATPGTPVS
jgi:sortase (surface protein transpeptidase)